LSKIKLIGFRTLPKRPVAVEFDSYGENILVADKFGDVYSLPLLRSTADLEKNYEPAEQKIAKPSASAQTVHTARNLKALEAQLKHPQSAPEKQPLKFEHSLLLGHISMLTDMQATDVFVDGKKRSYIITADRDEHIRISRGMPQAHIIEGFCFGHTQFVSKICLVDQFPHLLVSGGGDRELLLWDWIHFRLISRIDFYNIIRSTQNAVDDRENELVEPSNKKRKVEQSPDKTDLALDKQDKGEDTDVDPSELPPVSGIWSMSAPVPSQDTQVGYVFVALEGLAILLILVVDPTLGISHYQTLHTQGNVLDVAPIPSQKKLLVSLDTLHVQNSTRAVRAISTGSHGLEVYSLTSADGPNLWSQDNNATQQIELLLAASREPDLTVSESDFKAVREFLYTIGPLRKRSTE
jgi:tRNA (guanine-N(7)-)-methyltransferase subunit TRM82